MKNYVRVLRYQGPQEAFPDKVITDINGFTHEPVVYCDVKVVQYTFIDYTKQMMLIINRYK